MKERMIQSISKMYKKPIYRFFLFLFGILSLPLVLYLRHLQKRDNAFMQERELLFSKGQEQGLLEKFYQENLQSLKRKREYFKQNQSDEKIETLARQYANEDLEAWAYRQMGENANPVSLLDGFRAIYEHSGWLILSLILSLPMHLMVLIYSHPYAKYVFERVVMMIFVIFGVTWLVFTIMYFSPMDPAKNVLGELATQDQILEFQRIFKLDQPYHVQLFSAFKRLLSFDLGKSYVGNEDVKAALLRKFPVTLQVTIASLILAVGIAIPAGVISAIRQYSGFDYSFMILALIGLSIPNFWLGLVLILNFSIRLNWLPATFIVGNWKTLIMPAIVLGTGLSASTARMTRSSMLEVKHMGYVMTARAKGLSERKVILRHILGNAMIPIVTIIGLQFGGMLGGAAVTEKVFNISGIGSYIVDKQFIPDIPIVLAGVVYVAFVISLANLVVDLTYAFLDPRIKSRMKSY